MRQRHYYIKNLKRKLKKYNPVLFLIRGYQTIFSPDHGMFIFLWGYSHCRFYPSCSEYALEAIRQYGLLMGSVATLKRIGKCNPWHGGGYDPVKQI